MITEIGNYAKITANVEDSYIKIEWLRFTRSDDFRKAMDMQIDIMQQYGIQKILADNRNMKVISPEDQLWSIENWLPRAIEVGYRAIALVQGSDFFNNHTVERIIETAQEVFNKFDVKAEYFKNMNEAEKWIKEVSTLKKI